MSHSALRPATSRFSSLALALTAFFALTGAKGGCFGEVITPEEPGCAEGYKAVEVCATPLIGCAEGQDCVLPEPACELECVAVEACGPGQHLETVCEVYALGMPDCAPGDECPAPPPSDPVCHDQCVPDSGCEPGFHLETVCATPPDLGLPECQPGEDCPLPCIAEPTCEEQCVPDQPSCPPGTLEQVYCTGACPPDSDGLCGSSCERVCVPQACEPGYHEEWVCNDANCPEGQACTTECYPVCVVGGGDDPQPEPLPAPKE
jgi:hypothetical protein